MTDPIRNFACIHYTLPFKTFIKERGECPVSTERKKKFNIQVDGNEAKTTYDEIISLKSETNALSKQNNRTCKISKSESKRRKSIDLKVRNVNSLFKAVELGNIEFVRKNLSFENVNVSDQFGWTPLMSAAYSGHIEIVSYLLKLGAIKTVKDKSGFTASDLALKRNFLEIVELIKRHSHKRCKESDKESNTEHKIHRLHNKMTNEESLTNEGFYCDICKIFFLESSRDKHETSTLHIFNCKPKLNNTFYGIPKQNRGYQMLLNKGWKEDGGLGPDGEGKKYPVKTILKRDRKGLGQLEKNIARITHFNPRDVNAVKFKSKNEKMNFKKKDWEKYHRKDIAKTKALRQALS